MDAAKRIEPNELAQLMKDGKAVVLDMRRGWAQSDRKIPGALRVDPERYREFAAALPQGRTVVTYCT